MSKVCIEICKSTHRNGGHALAQLVEALRYKLECRGFDSRWCSLDLPLTKSFRPHYGLGIDSASNTNEYREYFLGLKAVDNITNFKRRLA
jgi:hypothetical protein